MYSSFDIQEYQDYLKKNPQKVAIFSTSKTQNKNVHFLQGYLIFKNDIQHCDSDFWLLGGGNNDIQILLNTFEETDWKDLTSDILHWSSEQQEIIIEAVGFGFDGMFTPFLDETQIPNAANFYLNTFVNCSDINIRNEIAQYAFLIYQSNTYNREALVIMKTWLLEHKYDAQVWMESKSNPLYYIEATISKATSNN